MPSVQEHLLMRSDTNKTGLKVCVYSESFPLQKDGLVDFFPRHSSAAVEKAPMQSILHAQKGLYPQHKEAFTEFEKLFDAKCVI
jgi:hypothetical protein